MNRTTLNMKSFRNQRGQLSPVTLVSLLIVALLGFLAFNSFYVVKEWEQAVLLQFGEIQGEAITEPGLKFKRPFIQDVVKYDTRLLRWDSTTYRLLTSDRRSIRINVTARWKITEPDRFLERVRTVEVANNRLNGIIESSVRNAIASFDLHQVVRSSNQILEIGAPPVTSEILEDGEEYDFLEDIATLGRVLPELEIIDGVVIGRSHVLSEILAGARADLDRLGLGIEIEDILIRQLSYTPDIQENVYTQMNAELAKISAGFRSAGRERAQRRLGEMERELATIRSEAERRSAEIRGQGDAEAIRIFAQAYGKNQNFFQFIRTMQAYDKLLAPNSTLILGTDSELYRFLINTQSEEE